MRLVVLLIALATSIARADSIDNALDRPRKVVGFSVRGKSKLKLRSLRYLSHIEEGIGPEVHSFGNVTPPEVASETWKSL